MKPLTVKELITHLETLDQSLPVVVIRAGKDHAYPVTVDDMKIEEEGVYFPFQLDEDYKEEQKTLIIGYC